MPLAIAKRDIKVHGSVQKVLKLAPLMQPLHEQVPPDPEGRRARRDDRLEEEKRHGTTRRQGLPHQRRVPRPRGGDRRADDRRRAPRSSSTDIRPGEGKALADQLGDKASFAELDVTSEEAWGTVVADIVGTHGRLDVLVNCAGILTIAPLVTSTLADFQKVTAVNQYGVYLGMRAALLAR